MASRRSSPWVFGVLLLGAAAVGAGFWWRAHASRAGREAVLAAVPAGAWLVATLDVAAARPLLDPMLHEAGGPARLSKVAGLGSVSSVCGFEPLEHVREVLVAAPEQSEGGDRDGGADDARAAAERGDFGVAVGIDGSLGESAMADCARKVIAGRGGRPDASSHGTFRVVSDGNAPEAARLAYRPGGPLLVGRGSWLDAMMDAVDAGGGRIGPEHSALRAGLASPPRGAPAFMLSVLLPKSLRQRLRAEIDAGVDAPPLDAYVGVLGVSEAGAAVVAGGGAGATTTFEMVLRCESADACHDVKSLVDRSRLALAGDLAVRLFGVGALVDTLTSEVVPGPPGSAESTLSVRARAPTDDLARGLARLFVRWAR